MNLSTFLFQALVIIVVVVTALYVYREYGDEIQSFFGTEPEATIFLGDLAVSVTIADEPDERERGLSGVTELDDLSGMLLVFEEAGHPKIWMRDMHIPLDIIFIDNNFTIVEIAKNVAPETYPLTYTSGAPARFVLEVNAHFADTFKVEEGDRVLIPPRYLPPDLREQLRE